MPENTMAEQNYELVSIVMPHWNQSNLISNAIMSIINQTYSLWELIIVDDGSKEIHLNNLKQIVENFDDSRIRTVFDKHEGLVQARNDGCYLAKSRIIVTQDSDDLSMPDRIEKAVVFMNQTNADVLYHGAYLNMWDMKHNCITRKYLPAKPFKKEDLLRGQITNGWYIFRKEVWQKKPFRLDTQYAYDWMAILDWCYSGFRIAGLDEGLYEYVRHDNSASIRFEKEGLRQQSFEKIKEIVAKEYGQTVDISANARVESLPFG